MAPYSGLTPETLLDAIESCGVHCDGRLQGLNSYENRVYQAWLDDGSSVVAKFYRPQRWSAEAIQEEHDFALELAAREIPVVAPLLFNGQTRHEHGGFQFALYPRRGGRTPEFGDPETLQWLGRFIARIHAVGATRPFEHRPELDIESFGWEPAAFVCDSGFVPDDLYETYASVVECWTASSSAGRRQGRCATCGCTETAMPAIFCGLMPGRTLSTSMTRVWGRRCRTCGCACPAIALHSRSNCCRCSKVIASSVNSIRPN